MHTLNAYIIIFLGDGTAELQEKTFFSDHDAE